MVVLASAAASDVVASSYFRVAMRVASKQIGRVCNGLFAEKDRCFRSDEAEQWVT